MHKTEKVDVPAIKELRRRSGMGVQYCRQALEACGGNLEVAAALLLQQAQEEAARREGRGGSEGVVASYTHHTGKLGALVEIVCETDFVARTEEFRTLARQVAEQVAAVEVQVDGEETPTAALLAQPWVRQQNLTMDQLVNEASRKFGETITIRRFTRFHLQEAP